MQLALRLATAALLSMCLSGAASAHALWLEPDEGGARLFYGEFDENLREASPGLLDRLATPQAKIAAADGATLKVEKTAGSFLLSGARGAKDSIIAEQVRVGERKQGDKVTRTLGRLAARYVPDLSERTALLTLDVVPAGKPGAFKVFYKGQPLAKAKLELIAESGWKREFHTDEAGAVEASLPWRGGYLIEVVHLDATAGSLGSESYDSVRSVTTLSFRVTSGIEPLPTPLVTTPKR